MKTEERKIFWQRAVFMLVLSIIAMFGTSLAVQAAEHDAIRILIDRPTSETHLVSDAEIYISESGDPNWKKTDIIPNVEWYIGNEAKEENRITYYGQYWCRPSTVYTCELEIWPKEGDTWKSTVTAKCNGNAVPGENLAYNGPDEPLIVTYTFPMTDAVTLKEEDISIEYDSLTYYRGGAKPENLTISRRKYRGGNTYDNIPLTEEYYDVDYKIQKSNWLCEIILTLKNGYMGTIEKKVKLEPAKLGDDVKAVLSIGSYAERKITCQISGLPDNCLDEDVYYSWYYSHDGTKWSWAPGIASYIKENEIAISPAENGNYYKVRITADGHSGSITSNIVQVNFLSIEEDPQNTTASLGQSASFSLKATGGKSPYTYQWYATTDDGLYNADEYGYESNDPNLKFSSVTEHDAGSYWCVVTDAEGNSVTSKSATLTVTGVEPFRIVTQPESQTVEVGKSATFTVGVSGGSAPYRYSWEEETADHRFKAISTGSVSLTLTPTEEGAKTYRVVIQDSAVPSNTAISEFTLTATKPTVTPTPGETTDPTTPDPTTPDPVTPAPTTPEQTVPQTVNGQTVTDSASQAAYTVTNAVSYEVFYTAPANKKIKTVKIPDTIMVEGQSYKVVGIAANAFKGSTKLQKVVGGNNLRTIDANAFSGCKNLKSIRLANGITTIGKRAFYKCTSLTKITIPANVSQIGASAFEGCKKLKSITIKTTLLTTKNVGNKAFKGTVKKATVKVPKKVKKAYQKLLVKKGMNKAAKIK